MGIKIFLEQYDETKWVALFMSENSSKKKKRLKIRSLQKEKLSHFWFYIDISYFRHCSR